MKKYILGFLLIGITLIFAGCSTFSQPQLTAGQYLKLAEKAQGVDQQSLYLKAANSAVLSRNATQAQQILGQLNPSLLTPDMQIKKQLLVANTAVLNQQYDTAYSTLQSIASQNQSISTTDQIAWHQLMAYTLQKQGNTLGALNERVSLSHLISDSAAQKDNLNATWQLVTSLDTATLTSLSSQTQSNEIRGWLALAIAYKQTSDPQQRTQLIANWERQYPSHPAAILFATTSSSTSGGNSGNGNHIALLLPLQGGLGDQANAIRNGFFAAYYYEKSKNSNVPSVTVLDTSQQSIQQTYQQAIQQGANVIVGPLAKDQIASLAQTTRLTVPTLVLNTLPNPYTVNISNLYQFSLSPLDDAQQAAIKARYDHHQNVLIIAPANAWGQNIAQAFRAQWQSSGGRIVDEMSYSHQQNYADQVRQLLKINITDKELHNQKNKMGKKFQYDIKPRTDADMIFLVAQPNDARLIRPLLTYYFAGGIPVYSTSLVYEGNPNPGRDRDLNGIIFADMPWVLTPQHLSSGDLSNIQQQIKSLWAGSYYRNPKLYAMGVDAYFLSSHLNQMSSGSQDLATGTISLYNRHYFYRKLSWAKMIDGIPQIQ